MADATPLLIVNSPSRLGRRDSSYLVSCTNCGTACDKSLALRQSCENVQGMRRKSCPGRFGERSGSVSTVA